MFFRLSLRVFIIGLLMLSSLWVAATFLPIVYSMLFPPQDIQEIVRALKTQGNAPPVAATMVAQTIASVGPLQRTLQIGYYSGVSATLHVHDSHTSGTKQVAYIAWFQKLPKPMLLLITRSETDGVLQGYRLDEGAPMSFVPGYSFPLVMFAFSLFLFRRRKSPMLTDTASLPKTDVVPPRPSA
jgi:hypothetical protein